MKSIVFCFFLSGCLFGAESALRPRRSATCNLVRLCAVEGKRKGKACLEHPDCPLVSLGRYLDLLVTPDTELEERLAGLIRVKDIPLCVCAWSAYRRYSSKLETSTEGGGLFVSLAESNISSLAAHKDGIKRVAHLDLHGCNQLRDLADCSRLKELKILNIIDTPLRYLKSEWFEEPFLIEEIYVDDNLFIPFAWVVSDSGSQLSIINMKSGVSIVRSGDAPC